MTLQLCQFGFILSERNWFIVVSTFASILYQLCLRQLKIYTLTEKFSQIFAFIQPYRDVNKKQTKKYIF